MTHKNTCEFVSVCSLLTACTSSKISVDQIMPMDQKSLINYIEVVPYENGFYYVDDQLELNYYDLENSKNLILGPLDEKTDSYTYSYMGSTIYKYDNRLCYLTNYTNNEGISYSSLTLEKLDGNEIRSEFDLNYSATQFLIHDGYVFCSELCSDESWRIHIHDLSGKEISVIDEEAYVDHLIADGKNVYYTTKSNNKTVLKYIDCNDLSSHLIDIDFQTFIFENLDKISVYSCEYKELTEDTIIHSSIVELNTKETIFTIDNSIINYFDKDYIYTSSTNNKDVKYCLYDWNGNLVKEIIPSEELLGKEYNTSNMFWKTNGSQIIRIINQNIIASATIQNSDRLYICSIENESCKFLNSEGK